MRALNAGADDVDASDRQVCGGVVPSICIKEVFRSEFRRVESLLPDQSMNAQTAPDSSRVAVDNLLRGRSDSSLKARSCERFLCELGLRLPLRIFDRQ